MKFNSASTDGLYTDMAMSKHANFVTIGLLWHSFSSDNLGVGALSQSQVAICEEAAKNVGVSVRFIVFGTKGSQEYFPKESQVTSYILGSFRDLLSRTSAVSRAIDECDIILDIGEGDSFADIYSRRRFRMQLLSKIAVLWKRKYLVLSPQTIGPFNSRFNRTLAGWVMNGCDRTYARDHISYTYLQSIGLPITKIEEAIDVAFLLPFERSIRTQSKKFRIGLNVSGLLYSGGYSDDNEFGLLIDYKQLVHALLEIFTKDSNYDVILVPHVLASDLPRDDDYRAISDLASKFPTALVAPKFASPQEAKSFIASLDFLTGARMHACIAAFSAGVPVVPIAYSRKFNGLFDSLNYKWYVDGKSTSTEEAVSKILNAVAHIDQVKIDLDAGGKLVAKKLKSYQDYLSKLIENASQKGR